MATLTLTVEISDASAQRVGADTSAPALDASGLCKQLSAAFMTQMEITMAANNMAPGDNAAADARRRAGRALDLSEEASFFAAAATEMQPLAMPLPPEAEGS